MYATTTNHCQVVLESLTNGKTADQQTLVSVSILNERLQNLQREHSCFANVEFSPHAQAITEQQMQLAVS